MLLLLLVTTAALAQDASLATTDYVGPAGGVLGGGAALAIILERVLRKGGAATEDIASVRGMVKDLHDWHSKEDEDGVKVWYVRKSLVDAIENLGNAVIAFQVAQERQTETLSKIATLVDRMDRCLTSGDGPPNTSQD